jgi:predicted ribosomally synthesized peptide with nif11-like leader
MALNNAKALVAKLASDGELAKVFAAIKSAEEFAEAAKKNGYDCTLDEFLEAKKSASDAGEGKMSEDELSQTSGGLSLIGVDYAFTAAETSSN